MKKLIPLPLAVNGTVIILSAIVVFHLLVVAGVVPFDIVWGGNLTNKSNLYIMESVSIGINLFMLLIVLTYAGRILSTVNRRVVVGAVWMMCFLFLLNTVGNLMAKNSLETYIFAPITLLLCVFCFRMAAFANK